MDMLYKVMVDDYICVECVGDEGLNLRENEGCIVSFDRYEDYGRVVFSGQLGAQADAERLPRVKRHATLVDQGKAHENEVRSKSMHRTAEEKITEHNLPMRLVDTHYAFDRSLVILVFTAPGRVDFRALLKDLNRVLNTRVELRQIGPRDQAAMMGGLGSCGRALCCCAFMSSFISINVKMAKAQGLSLNPANIIGACGRLKCCLNYELEGYRELRKSLPRRGARCDYQEKEARVIDTNPLLQTVRIYVADDDRTLEVAAAEVGFGRNRSPRP